MTRGKKRKRKQASISVPVLFRFFSPLPEEVKLRWVGRDDVALAT